jgi:ankyrin repeat protein
MVAKAPDPEFIAHVVAAIRAADVLAVERALASGLDANTVVLNDGDDTPLLVLAAQVGEWNTVRVLLDAGANPLAIASRERQSMFGDDTYNESMGNAMERAIAYDHFDVVEFLLQRGADANALLAPALDNPRLLRLLLDRGANPNGTHLGDCVMNGSLAHGKLTGLQLLLEYGADPNSTVRNSKRRVVVSAIEYGRLDEARALLAAGATALTLEEVEEAVSDAWMRREQTFRDRALTTARALGFDVSRT